ncbi:6-phospho-3-hexuloisomerase [Alkalicoccus luteus]|uniref:6-phospho-3-hexuloisomerase n=1 Tax=Alkalicoccus luteus TaxID=1237094 RepID=A0A969PPI1_9BACI|nr:6-phospho-3-hexuloisomerase [Alkalicoccus luteus]NJP38000.1 6-phospho-3-hexuloisomerase [Alkalicoccus luteus]
MNDITDRIISEITSVTEKTLELNDFDELVGFVSSAERLFIAGEGRSGLVGKMIAMRLMHAGYHVYVIGETITPSITENDLLIVLSGSGTTKNLVEMAKTTSKSNAKIVSFTTNADSEIANLSHITVRVPAATKHRRKDEPETIQPLGNQFDQSLHIILDAFIIYLASNTENKDQKSWKDRHANLE